MDADKYEIRNFHDGDEEKIITLFNETYRDFGGYVPRTVEYWRWTCLKRPDVEKEGIFLAFTKETGNLEGYTVVGMSGNIWELCYGKEKEQTTAILLERAVQYLGKFDVSSVKFSVPRDEIFEKALAEQGFIETPSESMFVSVLSFKQFLSTLILPEKFTLHLDEEITLKLKDAPFPVEDTVSVKISNDKIEIRDGFSQSTTLTMQADFMTLLSVLLGFSNPYHALFGLKLRIQPFWKIPAALRFLHSVRLSDSWFNPLSDYG
jgi:hypothetical protein